MCPSGLYATPFAMLVLHFLQQKHAQGHEVSGDENKQSKHLEWWPEVHAGQSDKQL